jgi:hypothetical protein
MRLLCIILLPHTGREPKRLLDVEIFHVVVFWHRLMYSLLFLSFPTTTTKATKHCNYCYRQVKRSVEKSKLLSKNCSLLVVFTPCCYFYDNLRHSSRYRKPMWTMCQQQEQQQQIEILRTINTNGGWMVDVQVNHQQQLSRY